MPVRLLRTAHLSPRTSLRSVRRALTLGGVIVAALEHFQRRRLRHPARGHPLRDLVPRVGACLDGAAVRGPDGARSRADQPESDPPHRSVREHPAADPALFHLRAPLRLREADARPPANARGIRDSPNLAVSAAGPLSNLLLAAIGVVGLVVLAQLPLGDRLGQSDAPARSLGRSRSTFVRVNVSLGRLQPDSDSAARRQLGSRGGASASGVACFFAQLAPFGFLILIAALLHGHPRARSWVRSSSMFGIIQRVLS